MSYQIAYFIVTEIVPYLALAVVLIYGGAWLLNRYLDR